MKICKYFWLVALILMLSVQVSFASDSKPFAIGGAGSGGGYYVLGGVIGNILTNNGIQARVQTTGGGRQNAVLVDKGEIDFGFTNNIEVNEEYEKSKNKNIRAIAPAFPGYHHFVVRSDQPIKTVRDIDGKIFGLTARGSTHDIAGRQVFELLNIKPQRIVNADRSDSGNMIRDGLIAGYFMTSGIPISSILELETNSELRFLPFSDEDYKVLKSKAPWLTEAVIPAGSYKGIKKDIKTFGSWNIIIGRKDIPAETVYNILKVIYANEKDIKATYRSADLTKEAINAVAVPLHPGAVKFYREQGVKIADRLIPDEMK
ncbi:MAG: TAXI family TRAP transporter solute-binding subunit [Synergistota bacterium]|nr:TAXI family TRAP transporter solute-binding subunit [Synergistota bacterium]